jgi:hypothetical protein
MYLVPINTLHVPVTEACLRSAVVGRGIILRLCSAHFHPSSLIFIFIFILTLKADSLDYNHTHFCNQYYYSSVRTNVLCRDQSIPFESTKIVIGSWQLLIRNLLGSTGALDTDPSPPFLRPLFAIPRNSFL